MKLFGIKACDTCRKARKALPNAQFVDVREVPLTAEVLDRALETFGASLINKSSSTWRGLDEADRAKNPRDLLTLYPTLMKRPFIVDGNQMTLGWKADAQSMWL